VLLDGFAARCAESGSVIDFKRPSTACRPIQSTYSWLVLPFRPEFQGLAGALRQHCSSYRHGLAFSRYYDLEWPVRDTSQEPVRLSWTLGASNLAQRCSSANREIGDDPDVYSLFR